MLRQCRGWQSPRKKTTLKGDALHYQTLAANGRIIGWCWILQGFLPSLQLQQQGQVSSLPRHVFPSSMCCTKCRAGVPAGGIPMPSVTAVSQGLCSQPAVTGSVTPLKTPCELETSGVVCKVLSICRWKWILMPHKFQGNCPDLFTDSLMSFFPSWKGVRRKRARPGQLWHHSSAVKTNLTFSPPGSPSYILYLEHWFIQCCFLLRRHKHHTDH